MYEKGSRLSVTEQGAVLQAFSKALGGEAHVLTQHPELMWQQMYNRLQWEGEAVQPRLAQGAGRAWMRLNPFTIQPPAKTMSPLGWSKK